MITISRNLSDKGFVWTLVAVSRVSVPQVARVLSEVYGDRMASSSGDGESFPLQQKLLVCCLLLIIRNGKSKEVQLGKVSPNSVSKPHDCSVEIYSGTDNLLSVSPAV